MEHPAGATSAAHIVLHPRGVFGIARADIALLREIVPLPEISDIPYRKSCRPQGRVVVHALEWQIDIVVIAMLQHRRGHDTVGACQAAAFAP